MMSWAGKFVIADYWAAYRGPAGDNTAHAHATLQICATHEGDLSISDDQGIVTTGEILVVQPGVLHRLHPASAITLLLIEPQSPVAQLIRQRSTVAKIGRLPEDVAALLRLKEQDLLANCLEDVQRVAPAASKVLDMRLKSAMAILEDAPLLYSLAEAAGSVGISEPRLRAIASAELGVPLSKWVLWRKLNKSIREIAAGADLAEAACAGGFSDQAHFTRTMRNAIGLTPGHLRASMGSAASGLFNTVP